MIGGPGQLDTVEVEALRTDRYLDALLSAARDGTDAPAAAEVDPAVRSAARHLRDELVRVHPSFRFEEHLAQRLAAAAARMRLAAAAGAGAEAPIVPFPGPLLDDPELVAELANPELAEFLVAGSGAAAPPAGEDAAQANRAAAGTGMPEPSPGTPSVGPLPRPALSRQVLVGGALTSAALSLAGAAFVAWRLSRGAPADPMARAVRAARAGRDAGRLTGRVLEIHPLGARTSGTGRGGVS